MLIFLPYEKTLFKYVTEVLPITFQNEIEMPGKKDIVWFIYKKWQVISTKYKLSECNFWWNCLEVSDKMDNNPKEMTENVKHCHVICLKFGDRFFPSFIMLG